jgi:hypothetical protein
MRMKVFSFIICFVFSIGLHAQSEIAMDSIRIDTIYHQYYTAIWKVTPRDTFAVATIAPVQIYAYCPNRSRKKSMDKMERKVAKVYPYAKAAGDVMRAYEAKCKVITDPKQQKALLDQAEAQMKAQFEKDLRQMTISEGVILVKLIDRETGNTSYKLVQELRGKMSAFMWQGMARIFGQNLKDEYDPHGEDVAIENIVQRIEDGTIPVQYKEVSAIIK